MAAPYIKSLKVKNYRVFKEFEIGGFRRINLIAGTNGTGKTTLLEAIFFIMDRGNIVSLVRPLQWRQLPATLEFARETLFSDEKNNTISMLCVTRDSKVEVIYEWGAQKLPANRVFGIANKEIARRSELDAQSDAIEDGFSVNIKKDNIVVIERSIIPDVDGFKLVERKNELAKLPTTVMLSRFTMHFANDIAMRYSNIARSGRKDKIIDIARRINPAITGVELFQIANVPILHVQLGKGGVVPASLAGDGVLTMLSIGLAIMDSERGVVILDEFDAAIHFSQLKTVWEFIDQMSKEHDCQIFAATHSRECIDAAIQGVMGQAGHNDFAYYRMDSVNDRVIPTRYDAKELFAATSNDWEVR